MADEQMLTVTDVATRLNLKRIQAWRLTRSGAIPSHKIGRAIRIRPSELEEMLNRTRTGPIVG